MGALLDGGAQIVILETFTDLSELLVAVEVKHSLHHCPVVACVAFNDPARVERAFEELRQAGADVVGVNCSGDPPQIDRLLPASHPELPVAAFPSAGLPVDDGGTLRYPIAPEEFASGAEALTSKGVRFLGGCCGTTPNHIVALTSRLGLPEMKPTA